MPVIEVIAWKEGSLQKSRLQGRWLIAPVLDIDAPLEAESGRPSWAVGLDDDGRWFFYLHFPAGGLEPPQLYHVPSLDLASKHGVPDQVLAEILDLLGGEMGTAARLAER